MENQSANLVMTATIDTTNNIVKTKNLPIGQNDEDGNTCAEFNLNSILLVQANMEDGEYDVEIILKKK